MGWAFIAVALVVGCAIWLAKTRRKAERLSRARDVAGELLPEIRALMDSADPTSPSEGEPPLASHYQARHEQLPQVLSGESYFAVETFYQCVESYRGARASMMDAFTEGTEGEDVSLGDRIRAKDRRDRCLKDVYYTGHGAVEKLERILSS